MRLLAIVFGSLLVAAPVAAQDPVTADPQHHKVELENADVRVLRITFGPGEKAPAHDHPNAFAVFMTDAKMRISPVGQPVNEDPRKRGEVVPLPAGKHSVENLGGAVEILLVELKNAPAKMWKAPARDATKVDPKHYTVAGENDQARAIRISFGANETTVMHDHPASVVVPLTDAQVRMAMPGGKSEEVKLSRGTPSYAPAGSHHPSNSGGKPFEAIQIELKSSAMKGS